MRPSITIASTIGPTPAREAVFVDSGAWIAVALSRDPLHAQAPEQWELLHGAGAKVQYAIETFTTFLHRNAKNAIYRPAP